MPGIRVLLTWTLVAAPVAAQGVPVAPLPARGFDARIASAEPDLRQFGAVVALQGDVAVVSNPRDIVAFPPGAGTPAVHVFRRSDDDWSEETVLTAPDPSTGFGDALAVCDGFVLVGEPGWGPAGEGAVHVYASARGAWSEVQLLPGPPGASDFRAGISLSASRRRLAVGGDRVRVYALNAGAWALEQELDPVASGKAALHGDHLVALAPSLGDGGVAFFRGEPVVGVDLAAGPPSPPSAGRGTVRRWSLVSSFDVPTVVGGIFASHGFGASLAVGDAWAFIGAPNDDPFQFSEDYLAGVVYAFRRLGDAWFLAPDLAPPESPGDPYSTELHFGQSLALEDDTLWVGAPSHHHHSNESFPSIPLLVPSPGKVHRFDRVGDTWTPAGGLGDHPASAFRPQSMLAVGADELLVGIGQDSASSGSTPSHLSAFSFDAVLRWTAGGAGAETVVDTTGDGTHPLLQPQALARNAAGDLFIASYGDARVFRWDGAVLHTVVDAAGAGPGDGLSRPIALAVDAAGNLFVAGAGSSNVLKVTPGGAVTEIIDSSTAGFSVPRFLVVDPLGRVFVAGSSAGQGNVFRVDPDGTITLVLHRDVFGPGSFLVVGGLAVDGAANVYATGVFTDNVARIRSNGVVGEFMTSADGLDAPRSLAVDATGNLFVSASHPAGGSRIWRRTPAGVIQSVIGPAGDGVVPLASVTGLAVDPGGTLFVGHQDTALEEQLSYGGVFRLPPGGPVTGILFGDLDPSPNGGHQAIRHGTSLAAHAGTVLVGADQVEVHYESPPGGTTDDSGPGEVLVYEVSSGR